MAQQRSKRGPKPVNEGAVVMSAEDAATEAALREDIRRTPKNSIGTRLFDRVPGLQDRIRAHVADQRAKGRTAVEVCRAIGVSATWLSNISSAVRKADKPASKPTPRKGAKPTRRKSKLAATAPTHVEVVTPSRSVAPLPPPITQGVTNSTLALEPIPAPAVTRRPAPPPAPSQTGTTLTLTSYQEDGRPFRTVELTLHTPEELTLRTVEWLRAMMGDLHDRGVLRDSRPHEATEPNGDP